MAKVLILGIRQQSGLGKESGQAYSMSPQVVVATRLEPVETPKLRIRATGYEAALVDCTDDVFALLSRLPSDKYPATFEVDQEMVPRNVGGRQVVAVRVVGVKAAA